MSHMKVTWCMWCVCIQGDSASIYTMHDQGYIAIVVLGRAHITYSSHI